MGLAAGERKAPSGAFFWCAGGAVRHLRIYSSPSLRDRLIKSFRLALVYSFLPSNSPESLKTIVPPSCNKPTLTTPANNQLPRVFTLASIPVASGPVSSSGHLPKVIQQKFDSASLSTKMIDVSIEPGPDGLGSNTSSGTFNPKSRKALSSILLSSSRSTGNRRTGTCILLDIGSLKL